MKRSMLSVLATIGGLLLSTTAHASYVEHMYSDDTGWKSQTEVDAQQEEMRSGVQNNEEDMNETEEMDVVDDEDQELDESFGSDALLEQLNMNTPITREQFTALMVRKVYTSDAIAKCLWEVSSVAPTEFSLLFTDVRTDSQFGNELCIALHDGLIRGYRDGSFRPNATITLPEAAKILSRAFSLAPFADAELNPVWFEPYVKALGDRNAIPVSVNNMEHRLTVGEAMDMMNRLIGQNTWSPSQPYQSLIASWQRANAPRKPAPARVPVAPRTNTTSTPTSTKTESSVKSAAAASTPAMKSDTTASEGAATSRPKAWYEF